MLPVQSCVYTKSKFGNFLELMCTLFRRFLFSSWTPFILSEMKRKIFDGRCHQCQIIDVNSLPNRADTEHYQQAGTIPSDIYLTLGTI